MEKVEMFKSEDGKIFDTEQDCINHEKQLEMKKWLCDDVDFYIYDSDLDSMIEMLFENKDKIKEFLS